MSVGDARARQGSHCPRTARSCRREYSSNQGSTTALTRSGWYAIHAWYTGSWCGSWSRAGGGGNGQSGVEFNCKLLQSGGSSLCHFCRTDADFFTWGCCCCRRNIGLLEFSSSSHPSTIIIVAQKSSVGRTLLLLPASEMNPKNVLERCCPVRKSSQRIIG